MNHETKLKLQAHLDGEVSSRDQREISDLLGKDSDARALLAELQLMKTALRGNELEIKLPETREFYWSKIQRQIERETRTSERAPSTGWWKPAYLRFAGGIAGACALLMVSFIAFNGGNSAKYVAGEVEGNGEMGAITYRSDAERMTVVYLFEREADKAADFK